VNYAVAGGSATAGSDYGNRLDALSGTLSFAPGEVVKTVTVAITDDTRVESLERINFSLNNSVNAAIVDGNGVAVIGGSDAATSTAPRISVSDRIVSESDGYVDMVVTLSAPKTSAVSVKYATQDVAPAYDNGYDYFAASGTLNFAAGETTKTVRIHLAESATYDTAGTQEHFRFNLSAATGATLATQSATITIVDDDLAGQRVLSYGISDDTYRVAARSDVIVEDAGGGTDTVLSTINYRLSTQLENLTLLSPALTGTGNNGNNLLVGNARVNTLSGLGGNDTLDGRAGADKLIGGGGNDVYIVDDLRDVVTEEINGGTDLVKSSVNHSLMNNVENLTLTGNSAINGAGNDLANDIVGNSFANRLSGGGRTDTLNGADGNDNLTGGAGADTFVLSTLVGSDTITDFASGVDKLRISQAGVRVGDGDRLVEGAVVVAGPGGFSTAAELVIVEGNVAGGLSAADAAPSIGSATSAYALGARALFAVDNGFSSAVFLFTSANTDAVVAANELKLLATLNGAATLGMGDFVFGA
jgi:Ca2+-binding RTX toxin-like protein